MGIVLRTVTLLSVVTLTACGVDVAAPELTRPPSSGPGYPIVDVDGPGIGPWDDRADYVVWRPPAPAPRTPTEPCAADDLVVARTEHDGAGGRTFLYVTLEKVSPDRCTLAGFPALWGTEAGGSRIGLPVDHDAAPAWPEGETPATIGPHETALFTTTTGEACPAGDGEAPLPYRSWTDVDLVLSDATQLPLSVDLTTVCDPRVTRFSRPGGYPTEPPSRWPGLSAKLVLPSSVRRGQTVDYLVVLRNTTEDRVDLRPCGGYRQEVQVVGAGMAAEPVKGGRTELRLSCDASPTLSPGEERRFAMRLVLPDTLPGDEVLFSWGFVDNLPDYSAQQWVELAAR